MSSALLSEEDETIDSANGLGERAASSRRSGLIAWLHARSYPVTLCLAVALYCGLAVLVFSSGLSMTGTLTYPLDDAYIGMAMAKNFALHGVWGVTPAHFSSASSSPGFLILLSALYKLTGPTDWGPLALGLGFGILVILMALRVLKNANLVTQVAALCAVVFFTPLHVIGLLGMEHTVHIALILAFLDAVGRGLAAGRSPSLGLLLLASATVLVRYESLFVIAVACLLYMTNRQIKAAMLLGLAGAIPVVAYGIIAAILHSYWLPHSIALKGLSGEAATHSLRAWIEHFASSLARAPYLGVLLAILFVLLVLPSIRAEKRGASMLAIVLGSTLLHLALADIGWAYRYEAYLVASAIVAIAFAIPQSKILATDGRAHWATAAFLILGLTGGYLLSRRSLEANRTLPYRSMAVYSQQIQMARFLQRFGEGASIAANDVGAINYYANVHCLDLVGLADQEVFALKQSHAYTTAAIAKLAAERQVKIAIVYDTWFSVLPLSGLRGLGGPPLPATWIRVARWRTAHGEFLGGGTVSFYATDEVVAGQLRDSLALFAPSLPRQVEVVWR